MTNDEDREREIDRALGGYRAPPPMPAEEMWAAIQAGLASDASPGPLPLSPWARRIRPRLVTALAASLALFITGTGVGYSAARRAADDPDRTADAGRPEAPVLYRVTWF